MRPKKAAPSTHLVALIPATHVTAVTYLLPVWGLFWGFIAHEPILWTAYVGVIIVIVGLMLLNTASLDQIKVLLALPSRSKPGAECDAS